MSTAITASTASRTLRAIGSRVRTRARRWIASGVPPDSIAASASRRSIQVRMTCHSSSMTSRMTMACMRAAQQARERGVAGHRVDVDLPDPEQEQRSTHDPERAQPALEQHAGQRRHALGAVGTRRPKDVGHAPVGDQQHAGQSDRRRARWRTAGRPPTAPAARPGQGPARSSSCAAALPQARPAAGCRPPARQAAARPPAAEWRATAARTCPRTGSTPRPRCPDPQGTRRSSATRCTSPRSTTAKTTSAWPRPCSSAGCGSARRLGPG